MTRVLTGLLKRFKRDERGAITVDWVVLTAAVVGLAIAIVVSMQSGALSLTGAVGEFFEATFFND